MMLLSLPDFGFVMNPSNENADEYNEHQKNMTIESIIGNIGRAKESNIEQPQAEGLQHITQLKLE